MSKFKLITLINVGVLFVLKLIILFIDWESTQVQFGRLIFFQEIPKPILLRTPSWKQLFTNQCNCRLRQYLWEYVCVCKESFPPPSHISKLESLHTRGVEVGGSQRYNCRKDEPINLLPGIKYEQTQRERVETSNQGPVIALLLCSLYCLWAIIIIDTCLRSIVDYYCWHT